MMRVKSKKEILRPTVVVVAIVTMMMPFGMQSRMHFESTNPPISRREVTQGFFGKTLFYDGMNRTFWAYVPSSYDGSHQIPLVLALHGAGGDGYSFGLQTGWMSLSEGKGFIVVCPTGSIPISYGFKWNIYNWTVSPDDVGFLMTLITQFKSDYKIDPNRVYMTGHSNGASMTNTFAFNYTNVLAAIAPVSGRWMTAQGIDPYNISQPNAPLPVYIWRGELETFESGYQTRDVQDQLQKQYWMDWNKVDKTPTHATEGIYKTEIYTGGDAEVRFTEIMERGHDTYDPHTTAKIWYDFFMRLSRDARGQASLDPTLWISLAILLVILSAVGVGVYVNRRKSRKLKLEPNQDVANPAACIQHARRH